MRLAITASLLPFFMGSIAVSDELANGGIPVYKFLVEAPETSAGEQRTIEIYRSPEGAIDSINIVTFGEQPLSRRSCGCIWISETECIELPCGGGTLDTADRLYLRLEDTNTGTSSDAAKLSILNLSSAAKREVSIPSFEIDENGLAIIAEEEK